MMSVLIRPSAPIDRMPLVPLAMGVAALDAVVGCGATAAALKWPNDLIVPTRGDRKIAGILAELVTGSDPAAGDRESARTAVVVGIGTNVHRPADVDPEVAERAVWLDELGGLIGVDDLAVTYLQRFAERLRQLEADPASLLAAYRERCATLGREVRVELPAAVLRGVADDIDGAGRLVVREHATGDLVAVSAGDVVHVRPT